MDLIENLISFFDKPESDREGKSPEGLCSLCWGHQKYDHQIREIYKDKQIDVGNHRAKYTRVKDFVVNKVDGIRLRKEEANIHECPTCGTRHDQATDQP